MNPTLPSPARYPFASLRGAPRKRGTGEGATPFPGCDRNRGRAGDGSYGAGFRTGSHSVIGLPASANASQTTYWPLIILFR